MFRTLIWSIVLCFVLSQSMRAQVILNNPQHINSKSGLPTDNVVSVLKDDVGFIWFATTKGLCRWDGNAAKVYEHNPADSVGISGNFISRNAFCLDPATNNLLIGTDNGLSVFDVHQSTFKNFVPENDMSNEFLSSIHALYVDRQGEIWIGTDEGLVKFNSYENSFHLYPFNGKIPEGFTFEEKKINHVFDIRQDVQNDSVLWLATLSGLVKFNKNLDVFTGFFYKSKDFQKVLNTFNKLTAHSNRKLYIGTWNADMLIFNTVNETFEHSVGSLTKDKKNFFLYPVIPFEQKSENELWISTLQGIGSYNTSTEEIQILKSFKNQEGSGFAPNISLIDEDKRMWLSSEYGVYMFHLDKQFFRNYFIDPVDDNHWFLTTSLFEDRNDSRLYIGYARGLGVHYFDLKSNTFNFIPLPASKNNIIIVRDILRDATGDLLFLCPDEIYKLSDDKKQLTPLLQNMKPSIELNSMVMDKNGRIWVGGVPGGLYTFDVENGQLEPILLLKKYFEDSGEIAAIDKLVIDKQDRIWFRSRGTYGYYQPGGGKIHLFEGDAKQSISCFYTNETDTLLVGIREHGIGFILPGEPDKGVQLAGEILTKNIAGLQKDNNGNFILLTEAGIEVLTPGNYTTSVFNENEGLMKFDTWSNRDPTLPGILYKLSDGRMVIGYRRGLGFFYPDSLSKPVEQFEPYISSLQIEGKDIFTNEGLFYLRNLESEHNRNFLSIEYSALSIENGKDIRLAHQMKNIDENWVYAAHRIVNYSDLQPGNYQFLVKAESISNPANSKQIELNITIHPPWWETWWAISIFILVFTAIIFGIYNYNLSRTLARKEALRLKELNNLKSRLYANITHEFRTPLTVIKGMTDEMIEKMSDEEQKRYASKLAMIERNSNKLLHLVKQMLDMSKIESGKMKLDLIQDDVVSYLQYVLESFQSMADVKNIKLVFYHETDKVLMDYDEDKIFIITSNLLSNAIKFTPTGGKVIFHVKKETTTENNYLKIKVQDSGIGIDEQHLPHVFDRFYQVDNSMTRKGEGTGIGLALTRELVELMKGRISVKSIPNESTEFCVIIPVSNRALLRKPKPIKTQAIDKENKTLEIVNETGNGSLPLALIVEDNPDVAKYIISCLAGKYRVKWSPDGKQGIDTAINTIPDIVISDVMMPEKDGFEVCETLKTDVRTSHIPIILLTAKATEKDRIEGLAHGADAYLTKPFNKKELFVRLEQLIKIRRALQEKFRKVEISLTEKAAPTGEEIFLKKAIEIIEKNLDNPELHAELLASNLNLSESQLYRKLKAISNKSTAIFIRGIRLSASKKLLETSTLNISEIAYQCGFNDPAWYSRAFKEEYEVSPSEYRK